MLYADSQSAVLEVSQNLNSPLYDGASSTLLQTLVKYFEWFIAHPGTSKKALSDMLQMQKSILPDNNLLTDPYTSARKLLEPLLVKMEVYHACPNDCILFRNQYAYNIVCPMCNANRYNSAKHPVRKFISLPVGPRLVRMFGSKANFKYFKLFWDKKNLHRLCV